MIIVSILNWEYIVWIDHKDSDEKFFISIEDYNNLMSWDYTISWENIVKRKKQWSSYNSKRKDIEEDFEKKSKENAIIEKYTITDQINLLRRILQTLSKDKELHEMWKFIDTILQS